MSVISDVNDSEKLSRYYFIFTIYFYTLNMTYMFSNNWKMK